jgi:hypothetical protein
MRYLLAACLVLGACAPRLSPPYRDFEIRGAAPDSSLTGRLVAAAEAAGWSAEGGPEGAVSTETRDFPGGLTRTSAALDLIPLDGGFVRVYVRAERGGLLGGRTKVYALDTALRDRLLRPISEALRAQGLVVLGTPRDRDEDATE